MSADPKWFSSFWFPYFDVSYLGVLFNQLHIPNSWPRHSLTYLAWIFQSKCQERCRLRERENLLGKSPQIMKKRAIKFTQRVFSDLSFALLSLGYVLAVRSEIIPCRFSHPAIFSLTNKGRQIVDTTSQNPLYEVSTFVLFLLNQWETLQWRNCNCARLTKA